MKPILPILLLGVSLAGCASLPHPALLHKSHHVAAAPAPVPAVIAAPAPKPPTLQERVKSALARHPIRWVH